MDIWGAIAEDGNVRCKTYGEEYNGDLQPEELIFRKWWESLQSSHISAAFDAKFKGKCRGLHNITESIINFSHCGSSQGASSLNLKESTKGASTYDCKAIH